MKRVRTYVTAHARFRFSASYPLKAGTGREQLPYTYVYTTGGGTVWPALRTIFGSTAIAGGNTSQAVGSATYTLAVYSNYSTP
jgi:hypothetical protein